MQRRITVPVLQLTGAADPCILPGTVHASTRWASGPVHTRTLTDIGHFPHQEAPAITNQILTEFLAG